MHDPCRLHDVVPVALLLAWVSLGGASRDMEVSVVSVCARAAGVTAIGAKVASLSEVILSLTLLVLGLNAAHGAEVPVVGVDEPVGATHEAVDLPKASPTLSSRQRQEVRRAYGRAQRGAARTFVSMGMMTGAALWFSVSEDGYYVPGPGMLFSPVLGAVGVGFMVSGLVTSARSSPVILREGRFAAPNRGLIARGDVASLVLQSTVFAFAAHRAVNEDPWGTLGVSAAYLLPAAATALHLRTLRRAAAEHGVEVGRSRASDLQVAMGPTSVSVRW